MEMDFGRFKRFAETRLQTTAFETSMDSDQSHIFHTSVESAHHQFNWTRGARNARNEEFGLTAGFLDTFSPNALADRFESHYFIGVHVPLFVAISEFSMFCFAQRDFFADVGDPSKETSPAPWDDRVPGLWLIDNTSKGGRVGNEHSRHLIPKDPDRYIMSMYLSFLLTRFVWLHELAHCFNGHVDYVQQHNLALRLYELPEALPAAQRKSGLSRSDIADTFQCLEFDADQSAFWANCNIQIGQLENIEGISALDRNLRIRLALFGSYAMTWLFEQFQNYAATGDEISHPKPLERLLFLFETASDRLLAQNPEITPLNDNALNQFDTVRARIPVLYGTEQLRSMFHSKNDDTRANQLRDKREIILKELEAFQFSKVSFE